MKTYIKLTALLLSAVLVLGGCSISQLEDEQSEPEVIKIGVLEPLSGAAEDGGRLELLRREEPFPSSPSIIYLRFSRF